MITQVKKIMTAKVISVPIGTTLFEAHQLMNEKRIRHLPITDKSDNVIGLLSQRDIQYVPDSKHITVELMMSSPVYCVEENLPLRKVVFQMLEKKISSLLVINEDEDVVGIVTTDDLLWQLAHLLSDEKEDRGLTLTAMEKQTIGEIANELSNAGI